jgi:hypothetical protein
MQSEIRMDLKQFQREVSKSQLQNKVLVGALESTEHPLIVCLNISMLWALQIIWCKLVRCLSAGRF